MEAELAVWLYGDLVALITQERRLRLKYTVEALAKYELGFPLLSLALPLRTERYTHLPVGAFLDGLLPEGEARRALSRDLSLRADDTFGLIRALGRDCAGAIVIQPADDPAPPHATTYSARQLSDAEIADLVANLREAPLGAGGRVRISLAGIQEKLLLTCMADGSWGQPVDGTPSTHILKPQIDRYPKTVENELFCMRLAKQLGLPVADVDIMTVFGRKLIMVERFDRVVHENGSVDRIHQEDFCQATSFPPAQKYEEDGGPPLKRVADILQVAASSDAIDDLLRAVTLNVIIGNGDAHAKNFSLLHDQVGAVRLAPLYDIMSTLIYGDDRLAMYIDSVQRIDRVTTARIINEATRWGMSRRRATEIVRDLLKRVPDGIAAAELETPDVPTELLQIVSDQLSRLDSE
ncbi:MAG TPA: HipA domain-containing protein [Dehalococcoidia bacterium]|nr:HipA domain-containing protein [Dehalococcoidia bacterium]